MINKYVMSRKQNVDFVLKNKETFINNSLNLSRYSEDDPKRQIAYDNFSEAYDFIMNNPDVENDYKCLQLLHKMLLKGLNDKVNSELTKEQVLELSDIINKPAKANLEIAIDVVLYILEKRLFSDGDVRVSLAFANKILIDHGNGFITVPVNLADEFREKLDAFKHENSIELKDWIYKYCVKGLKIEY